MYIKEEDIMHNNKEIEMMRNIIRYNLEERNREGIILNSIF